MNSLMNTISHILYKVVILILISQKYSMKNKVVLACSLLLMIQIVLQIIYTISQSSYICGEGRKFKICDYSWFTSYGESNLNYMLDIIPTLIILILLVKNNSLKFQIS